MPSKILIVRLGSLGDLVHTLPAVAAIRRAFPSATIDWLVDAPHRDFLSLVPVVSALVVVRDRSVGAWLEARRALRASRYDIAMDFQGLIKSAALARMSGARQVLGFHRAALRERAAAWFYTHPVAVTEGAHVIQKNLALAAAIGAQTSSLEFPIAPVESAAMTTFLGPTPGPYALLNPGAAWPNKRWPPDRLGAVARTLRERGLTSIVLWGPGERDAAEVAVDASDGAARLAPETGLRDLLALARGASLMVSGDTGPLHITSALGVPAVALFGPTNPRRNGPWDPNDISISKYETCACHYERRCRRSGTEWCLGEITADEVMAAVDVRMRRAAGAPPVTP